MPSAHPMMRRSPPEEPVTKPGDLYELGEHRLLCGDSSVPEHLDRVFVEAADAVLTDPPYGIGLDTDYGGMRTGSAKAVLRGTAGGTYRPVIDQAARPGDRSIGAEGSNRQHPTQKPTPMLGEILERWTTPGAIVADPFLGSGSVLLACEKTGRRCYGMELDPRYCDVIVQRWQAHTGQTAERITDGAPVEALA